MSDYGQAPVLMRFEADVVDEPTESGAADLPTAERLINPTEHRTRYPVNWETGPATAHCARVVLLATRIPQEPAVGLGVQLGQRSWDRTSGRQWPRQVYPVFHAGDHLAIPDLQPGAGSVPSQRP